jgi:VIT1/CCC1 family predicted Fe2+/Mn2+ transporter
VGEGLAERRSLAGLERAAARALADHPERVPEVRVPDDSWRNIRGRVVSTRGVALETLAREELGLNPAELGSPYKVAASSFTSFAIGAIIPVIPFLFGDSWLNFALSVILSGIALFAVGVGVSLFTGRSPWFSGARQLAIGMAAAAVTFTIGRLIGVNTT